MVSFPNYKPVYSAQRTDVPNSIPIKFGDGYEQRFSFGYSLLPQEWSLTFVGTSAEIDEIDTFLAARVADGELFDWTTPDSVSGYKWICKNWKKEIFDYGASRLTATFQQRGIVEVIPTWVRQLTSPPGNQPINYSTVQVVADTTGSVYVGTSYAAVAPNPTWTRWANITKFSASGKLMWSKDVNKDIGFGNSMTQFSTTPFFYVNSGNVIIASLYYNTANAPSSQYHKIICLDTATGALKWAKSINVVSQSTSYDTQWGMGVYTNSQTGNIYIVFNYSTTFGANAGITPGILTLNSSGEVTGCIKFNMPGSGADVTNINGIETRPDGSVVVYGQLGTGNYSGVFRRGFILGMNAAGTALTSAVRLYGIISSQSWFHQGAVLSNGYFVAVDTDEGRFHMIDPATGSYQSCRSAGISLGQQVLQIKERPDGTIAVLGWIFSAAPTAINNQWNSAVVPYYPRTYVAVYSSDMTKLLKYRETDIGSSSYSYRDHCRVVKGCVTGIDRYIGAPGFYGISSMDLSDTYIRYATLPSYIGIGNTFAKFASATTTLPISTSAAAQKTITTPGYTPESLTTSSSNYAPSVTISDNTTQWSYFSA